MDEMPSVPGQPGAALPGARGPADAAGAAPWPPAAAWEPGTGGPPPWAAATGVGGQVSAAPRRRRRLLGVALAVGAFAGAAVGAAAIAAAATGPGSSAPAAVTADAGGSTTTTSPSNGAANGPFTAPGKRMAGGGGFGIGGFGPGLLGGGGLGPAIYGQYTVKGPNGYETLSERTGTVSSVTDTSGSTWTLVVKSADGTTGTFTVDSGTSVDGGEMGIGSVHQGDTVSVIGVVSGSTTTAKQVTDETVLKSNAGSWQPTRPKPPVPSSNSASGTANQSATT